MHPVPYEWNTKYLTPLSYYRNKHMPCMPDIADSEKEATNHGSNSPDSPYLIIRSLFRVHGAQTVSNDLLILNINRWIGIRPQFFTFFWGIHLEDSEECWITGTEHFSVHYVQKFFKHDCWKITSKYFCQLHIFLGILQFRQRKLFF